MIQELSERASVTYQAPSLKQAFATMFLHFVATQEMLYLTADAVSNRCYTSTRVQEITDGYHFTVGGFGSSGVEVCYRSHYGSGDIGVVALGSSKAIGSWPLGT
jgi:hypothetical protein